MWDRWSGPLTKELDESVGCLEKGSGRDAVGGDLDVCKGLGVDEKSIYSNSRSRASTLMDSKVMIRGKELLIGEYRKGGSGENRTCQCLQRQRRNECDGMGTQGNWSKSAAEVCPFSLSETLSDVSRRSKPLTLLIFQCSSA